MDEQEKRQQLLFSLRSGEVTQASEAAKLMRSMEWLTFNGEDLQMVNLPAVDLTYVRLGRTNLTGANFARATLSGTHLSAAKLNNANLEYANLSGANLAGTQMNNANLQHSSLINANLSHSFLANANLRSADLENAVLTGADLTNADLSGAFCRFTVFSNVDLSVVKGLESIQHRGLSYVDVQTLYRSKGKIPEVFLQGCGVPQGLIDFSKSLTQDFFTCFISYSHADMLFAEKFDEALHQNNVQCWRDKNKLFPGNNIPDSLDENIRSYDKFLLCCSQNSLSSWWVNNEIAVAFDEERRLTKQHGHIVHKLIPVLLDDYFFSDSFKHGLRVQMRDRYIADFRGWQNDDNVLKSEIAKLIEGLRHTSDK